MAGPGAEEAAAIRRLGDTLEALVRTTLQDDPLAEGHARRFISLCREQPAAVFEWRATELRVDGKLALAASEECGGFILPVYQAGVRALRVTAEADALDALLLGDELADAEQGETTALRMHDWFWRGGAIGFSVRLAEPFDRVADFVLPAPIDAAAHWSEVGRVAIERWNDAAWKAGETLEAAEIEAGFRAPMERYHQRVLEGALLLGEADREALREIADDPKAWAALEMEVLLKHTGLRHTLPSAQLASRVTGIVNASEEVDARLLDLLGMLSESDDETTAASLDSVDVGAAVAAKVTEVGVDEDALLDFVDLAGATSVQGLVEQLAERAVGEGHALAALAILLRHWGPRRTFARIGERKPSAALVTGLMKAALDDGASAALLAEALADLPAETAITVLAAIGTLRERAQGLIEQLLSEHAASAGALIQRLLETPAGARTVGSAIIAGGGEGWNGRILRGTLQSLTRSGYARDYVLPLYRARGTALDVRLAALGVLEHDQELRDEVLRRRAADMMEPAEIRAALKEARAR